MGICLDIAAFLVKADLSAWTITAVGLLAQLFFSLRTLLQWWKSEKANRVISPSSYWILSVLGAYIMFIYGVLRDDFSIILGQIISYYVYLWNLNAKGVWKKLGLILQTVLLATPVAAALLLLQNASVWFRSFFLNEEIPFWLVVYGSAGQVIFTLRFLYQWAYSHHARQSSLPTGFWIISLVGSGVIVSYGIFRHDLVLILGQSFGFVAYIRNLVIGFRARAIPDKSE